MEFILWNLMTVSMTSIFITIAKYLGIFVLIYLVASFIASLRKLLPFLQIVAAILLLIFTLQARNVFIESPSMHFYEAFLVLLKPIICWVVMMFAWMGEGFFEVKIDRNKLVLFKVEEKWHLCDETEYVFHFRPSETGGFLSNTVSWIILSFLFLRYICIPTVPICSWIIPMTFIVMAIFDILAIFNIRLALLNHLFSAGTFILLIIVTICSSISSQSSKIPGLDKQLGPLTDYRDYSFELSYSGTYAKKDYLINYEYDKNAKIGLYSKHYPRVDSNLMIYDSLIVDSGGTNCLRYTYEDFRFKEGLKVKKSSVGPLFDRSDEFNKHITNLLALTSKKYKKAEKNMDSSDKKLTLTINEKDNTIITYVFDLNSHNNKPSALSFMTYKNTKTKFTFKVNNSLNFSNIIEYTNNPDNVNEMERLIVTAYETLNFDFQTINMKGFQNGVIKYYDVTGSITKNGNTTYYVRDSDSEILLEYDSLEIYNNALETKDFISNAPSGVSIKKHERFDYISDDLPSGDYYSTTYRLGNDSNYYFSERNKNSFGLPDDYYPVVGYLGTYYDEVISWSIENNEITTVINHKINEIEYKITNIYIIQKEDVYEYMDYNFIVESEDTLYHFTPYKDNPFNINASDYALID